MNALPTMEIQSKSVDSFFFKNHIKGLHLRLPHELKRLESLIFIRTLILIQLRTLYWSDIKIHQECSRLLHLMSTYCLF